MLRPREQQDEEYQCALAADLATDNDTDAPHVDDQPPQHSQSTVTPSLSQVRNARIRRLDTRHRIANHDERDSVVEVDDRHDPPAEPPTPYEGMSNRQLRGEARRRGLRGQPHIGRGNRRNALIDFLRRGSLDNLEDCWVERQ